MDLIRLLRSLEEFLYELVGWLVFYPRTLWQTLFHPGRIAVYTRQELTRPLDVRFQSTISPVLMLILSVALAHALELATRAVLPPSNSPVGQMLMGSEEGLMLTRSAIFCIYALGAALGTLRRQRVAFTRESLREPFSIQAFLACPFILLLALGEFALRAEGGHWHAAGLAIQGIAVCWYIWARTQAFRALHDATWLTSLRLVVTSFCITSLVVVAIVALLLL